MKIKIDNKNKTIIAEKIFKGKKIKGVARCQNEDKFDIEFGTELAKKKVEIKENYIKMLSHDKYVRRLQKLVQWANNEIVEHTKIADDLSVKLQDKINDCNNFIKEKYSDK